ncbi:hypothetical protein DDE18_12375 [Nocardioides gansuensis]|uniref:Calcium-binding protein n=1 Tax=Nocardioides gansuensis TaxID=2138300 RepID=A0A2T8F982_9ACTN|nr:calcium-binding protein [Nocardioides gansuensis]PVG82286.1 hypothetical protein DDE18_12375 [Nocardioides gansuensis]
MKLLLATALVATSLYAVSPASAFEPTCDDNTPTIVGTPGDDTVLGTPGDDVIMSFEGNDDIDAGGGNDLVCAGEGDDTVLGGDGSDRLFAGSGDDVLRSDDWGAGHHWNRVGGDFLSGGPGSDDLRLDSRNGAAYAGYGHDWMMLIPSAIDGRAYGEEGNDRIHAEAVPGVVLDAGRGRDHISTWLENHVRGFQWWGAQGRDELTFQTWGLDVPRGTEITMANGRLRVDGRRMGSYDGIEEFEPTDSVGLRWVFRGTPRLDDFEVEGSLAKSLDARTFGANDVVQGTTGRDRLDLGSGRDKARAGRGRDVCISAERAMGCEVRR